MVVLGAEVTARLPLKQVMTVEDRSKAARCAADLRAAVASPVLDFGLSDNRGPLLIENSLYFVGLLLALRLDSFKEVIFGVQISSGSADLSSGSAGLSSGSTDLSSGLTEPRK